MMLLAVVAFIAGMAVMAVVSYVLNEFNMPAHGWRSRPEPVDDIGTADIVSDEGWIVPVPYDGPDA